jgi:SAM-dependent methyltransferase
MEQYSYGPAFMQLANMNQPSASRIVPIVQSLVRVNSIVDFGCAYGSWLAVWRGNGVEEILGLDGDYVDKQHLLIAEEQFKCVNLALELDLKRQFDLVQSLEVAEHIEHRQAHGFVQNLTKHGSMVLFSAAPPGQGGEWHINEQPYSYWRDLFALEGYELFDCIRPLLKDDKAVQVWYRYNIFLYVHKSKVSNLPETITKFHISGNSTIPDISPATYKIRKFIVNLLPDTVKYKIAKWLSKRKG